MRQRLAKIGFTAADLKELDADHALSLLNVSHSVDLVTREYEEKAAKKSRTR